MTPLSFRGINMFPNDPNASNGWDIRHDDKELDIFAE